MFIYIKPLIYSLLMVFGLEILVIYLDYSAWILFVLFVINLIASWQVSKRFKIPYLPSLFVVGSAVLLFFVDPGMLRHIYITSAGAVYYLILYSINLFNENKKSEFVIKINYITSLITLFLWLSGIMALYLNSIFGVWTILGGVFFIAYLISYQLLKRTLQTKIKYFLVSFVLAYCVSVIAWACLFLPFSYLTLSAIIFASYFIIVNYFIQNKNQKLTKLSFTFDVLIFVLAVLAVLYTAKWEINPQASAISNSFYEQPDQE